PPRAYFETHTRMWELALGGLLALGVHKVQAAVSLRAAITFTGLASIMTAGFLYSGDTAFPGYTALLPTVGTALVILGGDLGSVRGLNLRPLLMIGDRSYSIYLWHWPLIVFYGAFRSPITFGEGLLILAATLAFSELSYRYVEERYRHSRGRKELRPILAGAASIAGCVAVAGSIQYAVSAQAGSGIGDPRYPGAMALSGAHVPNVDRYIPAPAVAKKDYQNPREEGCLLLVPDVKPNLRCVLGNVSGRPSVFLVGDSHAGNWRPAFEEIARINNWRLSVHLKSACPFIVHSMTLNKVEYWQCRDWAQNVLKLIEEERPEYVFVSQGATGKLYGVEKSRHFQQFVHEAQKVRDTIESLGITVFAIADTPQWREDPVDCEAEGRKCSFELSSYQIPDPLIEVYGKGDRIISMTEYICPDGVCVTVVGNVLVWRDNHHLTKTYALSTASLLAKKIVPLVER
ncbi:acyltransferase family protein, partial [Rhizobiaceae sp. 2RAB30]